MNIQICTKCNGTGEVSYDIGTHNSEYVVEPCNNCKGTGRVLLNEYSYTIPFMTNEHGELSEFYNIDQKIHNLIREIKSLYK